ncbi:hypothetical protein [Yersinia vastinensis]|uniref:hypothetical protein n=1 Tax=Yersinia vastinensis TaxID=2890318 RepID=UPI001643CEA0|nr:hypothetical protein [Yersinia vastinensis]
MSNFVKIKKDDKYFILNTERVESVFPDAPGSIIKLLNGDPIRTFAEIDDIAAALIPAVKSGTVIDAVSIYPQQESAKPESTAEDKQDANGVMLNTEETIFRRRYYHNGAHAGFILYANEPDLSNEMEEDIARKIEELGSKVEFKNIFIDTSAPDNKPQEPTETDAPIQEMKPITVNDAIVANAVIKKMANELKYHFVRDDIIELLGMVPALMFTQAQINEHPDLKNHPGTEGLEQKVRRLIAHWISSRKPA